MGAFVGQGFTVNASALSAGGQQVSDLESTIKDIGSDVSSAIKGMAGAASGHAGLASALSSAAGESADAFAGLAAVYRYVSENLESTAGSYGQAEQANVAHVSAIGGPR